MNKTKIFGKVGAITLAISMTISPFSSLSKANTYNKSGTSTTHSNTNLDKAYSYIKVDSSTKQYKFDKGNYKDNTGASNQEVENMQKEVNDINNKVKEAKHVKVENGQLVTYATDQEVNNELEKKGYTTNRDNSNNVSLESGGISKAVYGKKGSVTMYLSHGATTAVVSAGAAGALGGLIGGTLGGFIGSFAGHIVSTYGGKAIPKNGIIVKGKVDGTVYSITTQ